METVRHHVQASGNSSLRGFFGSENVDYDPPSNSLRVNIQKAKCQHVYGLADGATDDDDEREITRTMAESQNSYELIRMVFAMGGWAGMDDELEEGQVDQVAPVIAQVLDQRDYVVYQLIRRHLVLLNYAATPTLGDVFLKILGWPLVHQPAEIDHILIDRGALLKGIASATLRNRANMVGAAVILPAVIQACATRVPPVHRRDEVVRLMFEANYTSRICASLERLRYDDLYNVILDMADPAILDQRQRVACHDAVLGLTMEFAAAEGAVTYAGDNAAKTTVARFMLARKAALDTFAPLVPPATVLTAIAQAIGSAAGTIADLRTAVVNLPDILGATLSLPSFTGSDRDDNARFLIGQALAQGWLSRIPTRIKIMAVNACLGGGDIISAVTDDEEIAINNVLRAARDYDQAELYQIAAAVGWEELYSAIDGDEYDELEDILAQPF